MFKAKQLGGRGHETESQLKALIWRRLAGGCFRSRGGTTSSCRPARFQHRALLNKQFMGAMDGIERVSAHVVVFVSLGWSFRGAQMVHADLDTLANLAAMSPTRFTEAPRPTRLPGPHAVREIAGEGYWFSAPSWTPVHARGSCTQSDTEETNPHPCLLTSSVIFF